MTAVEIGRTAARALKSIASLLPASLALATGGAIGSALAPGDLMFAGYNADQDGWAVVALVEIGAGTTVYFGNDAWAPQTGFAPGGGFERWSSGAASIRAGTVIKFEFVDDAFAMSASAGTFTRAVVPGSSHLSLGQTAGTLYAYQGVDASLPSNFVTAISNGGFTTDVGALAGTGLAAGRTALSLPQGADFAQYDGSRTAFLKAPAYQALLAAGANWTALDGGQYRQMALSATPLAVDAVPEPSGLALLGISVFIICVCRSAHGRDAIRSIRCGSMKSFRHGMVV